ncbi:MAG: SbcC/MukB-like Walker B domain-containing protein, partial [Egibacteraceae bacterium]
LAAAETRTAERRQALEEATRARDGAAADLGLRDWVGRLGELREALAAYVAAVEGLLPRLEAHMQARRGAEEAATRAEEAAQAQARHAAAATETRRRAVATASERDTLEATVGAQVEEILAELEAATRRLDGVRAELKDAREAHAQARTAKAVAEHKVATLEEALEADAARRQEAVDGFATLAGTGLLREAHAELPAADDQAWSTDRAVRAARRVAELLADVDSGEEAWRRVQGGIHRHLSVLIEALLPYDYEPSATLVDDVLVVTVPFRGRDCSMTQLRDALADEVAHRQSILDAREREVLENHLIGEVSAHLHDLLRSGEDWVRQVNAELEANPTSTGMKLRFAWRARPDGPAGLAEARTRLLRAGGTWSLAEREALGAFLQEQIRTVRTAQMTGTWQEHLAAALDYRAWHTFDVERWQDGAWKRLTRRTHGTGSGGEKAIALTIPQFAAAAAHFRSAGPQAPRLILLDEAFVGVDADMRSKCMGLLASFDLDFVMTSEREWGCYPTVPGLAIYQLATRPGVDAVGVTRWVWNGRQRLQANDPLPPASPPATEPAGVLAIQAENSA